MEVNHHEAKNTKNSFRLGHTALAFAVARAGLCRDL